MFPKLNKRLNVFHTVMIVIVVIGLTALGVVLTNKDLRKQVETTLASALPGASVNGCEIKPFTRCPNFNLSGANLSGAHLTGADLSGANLSNTNLSNADLSCSGNVCTNLSGANLSGANLTDADLSGVYNCQRGWIGTDLSNANLRDANLRRADLKGSSKWQGADLSGADLREANLWWVDLCQANLNGAKLDFAYYCGTTLPAAGSCAVKEPNCDVRAYFQCK